MAPVTRVAESEWLAKFANPVPPENCRCKMHWAIYLPKVNLLITFGSALAVVSGPPSAEEATELSELSRVRLGTFLLREDFDLADCTRWKKLPHILFVGELLPRVTPSQIASKEFCKS